MKCTLINEYCNQCYECSAKWEYGLDTLEKIEMDHVISNDVYVININEFTFVRITCKDAGSFIYEMIASNGNAPKLIDIFDDNDGNWIIVDISEYI